VDVDVDRAGQQQRRAVVRAGARIGLGELDDATIGDRQAGAPTAALRRQDGARDLLDQ
jgi:hypothetical protein